MRAISGRNWRHVKFALQPFGPLARSPFSDVPVPNESLTTDRPFV